MKISIVYLDINTGYYPGFHHGLAHLTSYLKRSGYDIKFYHIVNTKKLDEVYKDLDGVDVMGVSFVTNQLVHFRKFVSGIPPVFRGKLVTGGVHSTLMYRELLQEFPQISGVCVGEGEVPFRNYLRAVEHGEDAKGIEGFAFLEDGQFYYNMLSSFSAIEEIGFPDYSIFNFSEILGNSAKTFPMMLSRGCPFLCSYCSNHALRNAYSNQSGYVRIPSVKYAIDCIKNNLKLFPATKSISFADDTFTLNKKWLREFSRNYKEAVGIPFDCNGRVETINDDVLISLKRAGCKTIHFGVETGSEWLRNNILNRKQSNDQIIQAFRLAKQYGFKTTSSTITGLPFETQDMFEASFSLIRKIRPNFGSCFFFFPYPKTALWNMCKELNLLEDHIETSSGYLEKPSVLPIFISKRKIKANFAKMKFYFILRLLFTKIPAPRIMEALFLTIIISPIRRSIVKFMGGTSQLKYIVRRLGYAIKR